MKKILLLTAFIYGLHLGLPMMSTTIGISQAQESPEPAPEPKPKPESDFLPTGK
jgi:hypothetical protein